MERDSNTAILLLRSKFALEAGEFGVCDINMGESAARARVRVLRHLKSSLWFGHG